MDGRGRLFGHRFGAGWLEMRFVCYSTTLLQLLSTHVSESEARVARRQWEAQGWKVRVCSLGEYKDEIAPRISVSI